MLKRIALVSVALMIAAATPAISAPPKPTQAEIDAAKKVEAEKKKAADAAAAKVRAANATLKQLSAIAAKAQAAYNQALKDLDRANKNAVAALKAQKAAEAAVSAAHRTIGKLAVNAYILGGDFSDLQPLLSANGPQDLVDQISTLNNLGSQNTVALERFKAAEVIAKQARIAADNAKIKQEAATKKVAETKKVADQARADQLAKVKELQKIQDRLMKELQTAYKRRTTLEEQKRLAELEEGSAAIAEFTPNQAKIWPDRGFKGRTTSRSTFAMRQAAVAYAKKQVEAGKPYVWGAEGPNSFDCSGLVYAAYKSAGLGWPNWDRLNAALYSVATKHVPLSQMEPGDLLFYSYNGSIAAIHHITIYAGNGKMWEARCTKCGLKYSDVYSVKGLMPFAGRV